VANGFIEADLAMILRNKVSIILKANNIPHIIDNDGEKLGQVINKTKSTEKDVILDIHWNKGVATANGCEVFIPERHTDNERKTAKKILDGVVSVTGLRSRGVKTESQSARKVLGIMRPLGINLLIEVCFVSNMEDMQKYLSNIDTVAKVIAFNLIEAENLIK